MEPENLTLKVLIDIREEMRGFRCEQREMRDEIRVLRVQQEETNARLGTIEHTLVDAASHVHVLGRAARVSLETKRLHDERFDALERRVSELERGRT